MEAVDYYLKMHEEEEDRYASFLPVCDKCRERINEDWYYEIGDEVLCRDCMERLYEKSTNSYIFAHGG